MGDPKRPRKKYSTPRQPWRSDQLSQELFIIGTYGLRNKHELWRAQTELSGIRKRARALLGARAVSLSKTESNDESNFLAKLRKRGLVDSAATVDDVLGLGIEELLSRRLQTVVLKKELALTPHQARQMISHGHVMVKDRILTIPSYVVRADEEGTVRIREGGPIIHQASTSETVEKG